ncbi:threonine synthase, chloroplastic-like protein [Cinnamomum micranthum f. kanehirae]|uniref:Threonine synthase, chloroplastic-like protein n=1 Tax=Cinnamomum micranthum f. kanehirae TaxID=337451 RepID=A0A443PJW2_9MAGN|nr:threonine synthase, chloroplastic-like protein [Cinnamomum micranthum f. kanehirae]
MAATTYSLLLQSSLFSLSPNHKHLIRPPKPSISISYSSHSSEQANQSLSNQNQLQQHRHPATKNIREETHHHNSSHKNHSFSAKYVPFNAFPSTEEEHSLDDIIYSSRSGSLLDISHNMDALHKFDGKY